MIVEVSQYVAVASFAEAWIEMNQTPYYRLFPLSPPSRRRGLKYYDCNPFDMETKVASFAEAWIEIKYTFT